MNTFFNQLPTPATLGLENVKSDFIETAYQNFIQTYKTIEGFKENQEIAMGFPRKTGAALNRNIQIEEDKYIFCYGMIQKTINNDYIIDQYKGNFSSYYEDCNEYLFLIGFFMTSLRESAFDHPKQDFICLANTKEVELIFESNVYHAVRAARAFAIRMITPHKDLREFYLSLHTKDEVEIIHKMNKFLIDKGSPVRPTKTLIRLALNLASYKSFEDYITYQKPSLKNLKKSENF